MKGVQTEGKLPLLNFKGGICLEHKNMEKHDQINSDYYVNRFITKETELTINIKKMKNPAYLLEQLYLLKQKDELSDDEKNEEVRKIMSDYMR